MASSRMSDEEEEIKLKKEAERIHKAKFVDQFYTKEELERNASFRELVPLVENMEGRFTYETIDQLAGGTFSEVFKVRCTTTEQEYAMKTIVKRSVDGRIPKTLLNEIIMIYDLDHQNIVNFRTCCSSKDAKGHTRYHMIFELCLFDMGFLLFQSKAHMTVEDRKTLAAGLISGLRYIHSKNIIHRDLKPCNLLITAGGNLRIADFGQATFIGERSTITKSCLIGTPGYIAPEILFGAVKYGCQVDIWSAGVIIAEMFMRKKFIHGRSKPEQIAHVSAVFGTINEENWPKCETLPYWEFFKGELMDRGRGRMTDSLYNYAFHEKEAGKMVRRMLRLCPSERCSLASARSNLWFKNPPGPKQTIDECLRKLADGTMTQYPPPSLSDEPPMWH